MCLLLSSSNTKKIITASAMVAGSGMCYGNRIHQYFLRAIPAALFRKRNEAVFTSRINLTKALTPYWIGVYKTSVKKKEIR